MGKKEAPKGKEAQAPAVPSALEAAGASGWQCEGCAYENEAGVKECEACGEVAPSSSAAELEADEPYKGFKAGSVLSVAPFVDGKKLSTVVVDVGSGDPLSIVTSAPNVSVGARVIVATIGARLVRQRSSLIEEKARLLPLSPSLSPRC